jgi:signal transduction histidine kinase
MLIALVLTVFFYQIRGINDNLEKNTLERSRMVATIIEENLANATLALTAIDEMVTTLLRDKAEFIAYLDSISHLHQAELTALSRETGLLGISLLRPDLSNVSGPKEWRPAPFSCTTTTYALHYYENSVLFEENFSTGRSDLLCVLTGLNADAITELRKKTSLPQLLSSLSALPDIQTVELIKELNGNPESSVELITDRQPAIAQARFPTTLGTIVVSIDAHEFLQHRDRLRQQFFFFATLLLALGLFFSWLLYRFQQKNLNQAREFEQILGREHEAAALGRTTATIAHEIRNPLNAINMGLQRLQMESDNLDPEQKDMITAMRSAVKRTSWIVAELQRFTRRLQPARNKVNLKRQLQQLITLYEPQIKEQHLQVSLEDAEQVSLSADQDLLNELLENLLKNAIEAQPDGGNIELRISTSQNNVQLSITNGGFNLKPGEAGRIGEPYFTTKTRGTGLGLALSKRIAKAHGGVLTFTPDFKARRLTVLLSLPKI